MITASTEQLTESGRKKRERPPQRGLVTITQDNRIKTFSVYYNVVSPCSYKQLLRQEGDEIDELRRQLWSSMITRVHSYSLKLRMT
jgi:hypothetical protein